MADTNEFFPNPKYPELQIAFRECPNLGAGKNNLHEQYAKVIPDTLPAGSKAIAYRGAHPEDARRTGVFIAVVPDTEAMALSGTGQDDLEGQSDIQLRVMAAREVVTDAAGKPFVSPKAGETFPRGSCIAAIRAKRAKANPMSPMSPNVPLRGTNCVAPISLTGALPEPVKGGAK